MTVETFFEKFELFADTPNAVGKMRELILHLAVHGQLTEQSPHDEPAAELIERNRVVMSKLMAEGKAKREKPAADVTEREKKFEIPSGWAWARLVDAGQFINGLAFKPSDWGKVGRPIIRIQNLSGRNADYNRTSGSFDPSVLVQDGDILVSWSATLDAFIWRGEEGVLNQHIFRVLPAPLADPAYLYWLLKWVIRDLAESDHAHGLVMRHINRGPFLAHPIPIPPLAEQKRIVAKVDELMGLCDRLEAEQAEQEAKHTHLACAALARFAQAPTPANLTFLFHDSYTIDPADLRRSILTLAVQGKLVKREGARESVCVGDVVRFRGGYAFESHKMTAAGTRLVRNQNVSHGSIDWTDAKYWPDSEAVGLERFLLAPGDLVLSLNRPFISTGLKLAWITKEDCPCYLVQRIASLRPDQDKLAPEYLYLWCNAPHFYRDAHVVPSSGVPYIAPERVARMTMSLPPIPEQRRIVAKVDQLIALVDQLEAQLAESRAAGERLMEAVVAELTAAEPATEAKTIAPAVEVKPDPRVADAGRLACYIVDRMREMTSFGRTKLEKCIDFAQKHCGAPLERHAIRGEHGPVDYDLLLQAEAWAGEIKGFATHDPGRHEPVTYTPGEAMPALVEEAAAWLGECKGEFDRVLDLLAPLNASECGIRATAYTAWQDLLAAGKQPNDRDIIREARHNWHDSKKKITDKQWFTALRWLEHHKVVPKNPTRLW